MTNREFIQEVWAVATEVPGLNPEAAAAHAANESSFGRSYLAQEGRNLFGTKAGSSWKGETIELPTWEVVDGHRVDTVAVFRRYPSWRESLEDYADIIARVYPWAAQHRANPLAFLAGIFLMGPRRWATDPSAFQKAVAIMEAHGLLESPPSKWQLGPHALVVDNSPSVGKALEQLRASLGRRPAVFGPHLATRTQRGDGTIKLDLRADVE